MNNKQSFLVILLTILLMSFTTVSDETKYKLLRKEVVMHYKSDPNPLKIKAANFLLDNLKELYSIDGDRVKMYTDTIKRYYRNGNILHQKLLSLRDENIAETEVKDLDVLTPRYLIENIDRAFDTWNNSHWKNQVSFNVFCEYILPYRIGLEPLENWRKDIVQDSVFRLVGDSLNAFTDLKTAATWFAKKYARTKKKFVIKWGANSDNIPDLPYSSLRYLSTGTCANLNQITLFIFRAAGFPIADDFTPHWGNNAAGHDWGAIITPQGSIPYSSAGTDSLGEYKSSELLPSKVYRITFSENIQSHAKLRPNSNFLPFVFNYSNLIDVTDEYMPTCNIDIPITCNPNTQKFAYLGVSDFQGWEAVAWADIKYGNAHFTKVVKNIVYIPMLISSSTIDYINYPFIACADDSVNYLKPNFKQLQTVNLLRKYPLKPIIKVYIKRMVKGCFQASTNKDFTDAVTLFKVTENPGVLHNENLVNASGKYQFVRYLGSKYGQCNISEVEFYEGPDDIEPLKGIPIGSEGHLLPLQNAFDGDVLTYINTNVTPQPRWVGLDLGKPTTISKIGYVSRNDKNHIVVGNLYELFYWDGTWKSMGKQTATSNSLIYNNVPTNCLFLLRNYTEGREERIFTYENGEQVWR